MQRRDLFVGMGVAGLALAAPGLVLADAATWTDEFLRRYRKLRFALDNSVFFWWLRGTKYGVVDAQVTPLYNMEIASIFRCQDGVGAEFSVTSLELVYNTDLTSGEPLTSWLNPYTGEKVAMRPADPVGPVTVPYRRNGPELPTSLPGASMQHEHRAAFVAGDATTTILRDESVSLVSFGGDRTRTFKVSDLSTYQANKRELADKRLRLVPASVAFNAVSNWQRWMNMGDRPGNLLSRGVGRKVAALADLPDSYRTLLAKYHPEVMRDPAAALARPPAKFDR